MVRVVDDALGYESFQKKICRRRCELQGDTVLISQSSKAVKRVITLFRFTPDVGWSFRPQPLRVHAAAKRTR